MTSVDDANGLVEPVLLPPRGLVAATLCAFVLTAGGAVAFAPAVYEPPRASLHLNDWPGTARETSEMQVRGDRLLAAVARNAPADAGRTEAAFRERFAAWLGQERELGASEVQHSGTARLQLGLIEEEVRELVRIQGGDALQARALRWARVVRQAVESAVLSARQRGVGLRDVVRDPATQALRTLAPGFTEALADTGIEQHCDATGLSPAAALVVEAIAAQRVLQLGARLPVPPALALDQQALLLRFRVEAHEGLSLERKLQLLTELAEMDPGYPAAWVRGVLLARANNCLDALPAFATALAVGQHRAESRANFAWCRQRLAAEPARQGPPTEGR